MIQLVPSFTNLEKLSCAELKFQSLSCRIDFQDERDYLLLLWIHNMRKSIDKRRNLISKGITLQSIN